MNHCGGASSGAREEGRALGLDLIVVLAVRARKAAEDSHAILAGGVLVAVLGPNALASNPERSGDGITHTTTVTAIALSVIEEGVGVSSELK